MLLQWLLSFLLRLLSLGPPVKISTPLGEIRGSAGLTTRLGRPIISFRGIRYGQAPTKDNRFRPAVPTGPWNGTYDATNDGAICPQPPTVPLPMSEDCLFLNVYITKIPDKKTDLKRPVIVHFHGGSFVVGAGHSAVIRPVYLLDADVVLVTFNYRLGTLGNLAIGEEAPGNDGMKDQVLVLKWVKNNIHAFGGDPDSVTLYGFSAGACAINLHLTSDMSKSLFHRAVFASCSFAGTWPIPTQQVSVAQKHARLLGCPDDTNVTAILECLRKKPAQEIANTELKFLEFGSNPVLIWSPVIEEDYGQERFLKEQPIKSIVDGNFAKVPTLASVTKDEFAGQANEIIQNPTLLKQFNEEFDDKAPICFLYERNSTRSKDISAGVRHFYFKDEVVTQASLEPLGEAFADAIIGFGVNRLVKLLSEKSGQPVWYSEFTYAGKNGTSSVQHGADQPFLFPSILDPAPSDTNLIETMVSIVANFATNSDPNVPAKAGWTFWEKYDTTSQRYLDIGKEQVMRDHLFEDRYNFWESLYPLSLYS